MTLKAQKCPQHAGIALPLEKKFQSVGPMKSGTVFDKERTAPLTILSRENLVVQIASVHAGSAQMRDS